MQTLALSNEVFLLSAASDGVSTDITNHSVWEQSLVTCNGSAMSYYTYYRTLSIADMGSNTFKCI